jgi:hypothetical protein
VPLDNSSFVAWAGTAHRLLRAPLYLLQDAADMTWMVRDAKYQAKDRRESSAGPYLAAAPIGFGAAPQEVGPLGQLFSGEPPRGSRRWTGPQSLRSPLTDALHPLTDGRFADPHRLGDLALGPALLLEVPGLTTTCFLPVFGRAVHAGECSTKPLPLKCLMQRSVMARTATPFFSPLRVSR